MMPAKPTTFRRAILRGLALLAVGGLLFLARRSVGWQAALRWPLEATERLGPWGPVVFMAVYVIATVLFVPASALTLGAGAVFGVLWGCVYVSIASTVGATAAFLIGRYIARAWVRHRMAGDATFASVDNAIRIDGWRIVALARLSPFLPFTLLNYAFGVTGVKLRHYVLASWLGMMPGTVLYVYLGSIAHATVRRGVWSLEEWCLYGVGLAATLLVTLKMARLARQTLTARVARNH